MNFIVLAAVLPVAAAGNVTRCLEDNCKILTTTCHLDKNCSAGLRCVEVRVYRLPEPCLRAEAPASV